MPLACKADNNCFRYKAVPPVKINEPRFSVSVIQPDKKLDLLHGNVVSTFVEEYEITYGARRTEGGWCVFIENISAEIGYNDFVVQIDRRHAFDSCEWWAIKEHEEEHIHAHLSVVSDNLDEIKRSVSAAAAAILPVFAENELNIERATKNLELGLQNSPQIILLRQKLAAEQETRNKKVDLRDRGGRIGKCADRRG
jgi:hypothetical protein